MQVLITIYLFFVGAAFGSFALVLADRMRTNRNWVSGRSACEHCKHVLRARDLAPIVSWLLQRGKCRYCKKAIGTSYPLTELLTASLFALSYIAVPYELRGFGILLFILWLFSLVLMSALFVYDLRWKLLPTKLIMPLYFLGLSHAVGWYFIADKSLTNHVLSVVASVAVGGGIFALLWTVSKGRWIGDGDVRFGIVIGLFVHDPLVAWAAIFFASVLGILLGIPLLLRSKQKKSRQIPFGPYLILGLVAAYLYGQQIINWYIESFLFG